MVLSPSPAKLNLGCGTFKKAGYVNVDNNRLVSPEVVWDLGVFPYPFPDNHFDVVEADHVIEHLEKPFAVMKEIHRILKNNGELVLRVPHFSRGFTHADHKRGFDMTFPLYFNPAFQGGYTGTPFRLTKMRLKWFAQPYLAKTVLPAPLYYIGLSAGAVLDFFANISPMLCSRLWCFWVGGFEEIEFRLHAVK